LVEEDKISTALEALKKAATNQVQLHLPTDSIAADNFAETARTQTTIGQNVPTDWMGLDIGPKTIATYQAILQQSKTILWNGPMGVFEMEQFKTGTLSIAKTIAEVTQNGAYSLIGGGDSVAAINQFGLADQVSYVSTGGGAMLQYLEGKALPGVLAIQGE